MSYQGVPELFERKISEVLMATGGCATDINANENIGIFVINDKEAEKNCCYVSVNGKNHKGNEFALNAISRGASLVISEEEIGDKIPLIKVKDSIKALCDTAEYFRKKELEYVIAITGSVGKTTTKELCANVLSQAVRVHKTDGNKNSIIGLPLSVLGNRECRAAVLEAGISEKGEMSVLSRVARPDVAVITDIGPAHTETLGTVEDIVKEKLKISEYMPKDGKMLLPEKLKKAKCFCKNIITYGIGADNADYCGTVTGFDRNGSYFTLEKKGKKVIKDLFVPIIGNHACHDALAAAAAGDLSGCSEKDIREGLKLYKSDGVRQNITQINGITVIEDYYNMSPLSAVSALGALEKISRIYGKNKKIVMFGDMLELGNMSEEEHKKIGKEVVKIGAAALITVGKNSRLISEQAIRSGMPEDVVAHFSSDRREDAGKMLKKISDSGSVVLIKGSRGMRMEEFPAYLE